MSADFPDAPGTLPIEVVDQIDQICDRCEAARAGGEAPRIEDYLDDVTEPGRSVLLRELLASELEWRRGRGERPTPEEYAERFPGQTALIAETFEGAAAGRSSVRPRRFGTRTGTRRDTERARTWTLQPGFEPLAGYRLRRRLGRGGFGEVWEAEAPGGVPVALKFVPLLEAQGSIEQRALETIKRIRHPNLLALFGAWQVEDHLVMGMELADETLVDRLRREQSEERAGIPGQDLIEYVWEAAKGIDHLNDHIHLLEGRGRVGVQHRDIKPQNILLVGGGVKVADYGLARILDQSSTGHTGSLTPAYAAPEFFRNQTSDRSDQYSLAVTYCFLRGGRLPFSGGPAAMMDGHLHRAPDLTMVPKSERPAVARALSKAPEDRWPDCRAFVAAIRASLGADPTPVSSDQGLERAPSSSQPALWRRKVLAGVLVAVPLATGLTLWRLGMTSPAPHPPRPVTKRIPAHPEVPSREPKGAASERPKSSPTAPPGVSREMAGSMHQGPAQSGPAGSPATLPIAHRPGSAHPVPPSAARHLEQGLRHYDSGEFEEAIVAFSEAIAIGPAAASAFNNRGNAYYKLNHHDAALEDYDRAIQLDPEASVIHFNRGNAYLGMDRYEQATRSYTEAIRLNPRDASAYANRAIAYEKQGDPTRAASDRAQAARLESASGSASSPP